ncbi:MAG: hypothetical protein KDE04_13530 [Anaerolineales bacterium]|nr:hypothetical protein [Anaerolineales bacterium]MCB0027396.1 hypothetical protein [Anaerolineales bacterium]MCB8961612.1 2,4-dihydroxyhept-2-ene-1,7-dioic acid aldolase [Ardenticatenales bacterium]
MRENKIKTIWSNGGNVVNGWLAIPSSWSAEAMAHQGFDSLTVDMQHGLADYQTAVTMLQAVSTTDVIPMARVPWNEPGIIMRMLDAGCYGIVCPMINTRAEAEQFVGACRYHPAGYRSAGPTRARIYSGGNYLEEANDVILTFAMIETAQAIENLEDILSVPGLDAVYVGPSDLSITLGVQGQFDSPPMKEALAYIADTAAKHGVVPGIHTSGPEFALKMLGIGYRFVTLTSDSAMMTQMAKQMVDETRAGQSSNDAGQLY